MVHATWKEDRIHAGMDWVVAILRAEGNGHQKLQVLRNTFVVVSFTAFYFSLLLLYFMLCFTCVEFHLLVVNFPFIPVGL